MAKSRLDLLRKISSHTILAKICLFFLLVGSSFFISYILQINSPFFIQESSNTISLLTPTYQFDSIRKGQKVQLESEIHYSYFGILSMRFNTFNRINADSLIFRIKEKGSPSWYYQNIYRTDQFQNNELFPFGFPPIKDSRGKTYVYEVESVAGTSRDGVALSKMAPIIMATFQYSSSRLFNLGLEGMEFILLKYIHGLESLENIPAVLSPFIIYVFYRQFSHKGNQDKMIKGSLIGLVALSLFYVVLLGKILPKPQTNNVGISMGLLIFWIVFVVRYKIQSKFWFILAIFSLLFMIFVLFFKRPDLGDRAGALAYGFIALGFIQAVIELKFPFHPARAPSDILLFIVPQKYRMRVHKLLNNLV